MKIVRRTRKQVFKRWIAALRSGEYKQATKMLKDGNSFCCLGVLCDLASKDGGPKWEAGYFLENRTTLPLSVQLFVGLLYAETESLASMNDGGSSFKGIADRIEKVLMPRALNREYR